MGVGFWGLPWGILRGSHRDPFPHSLLRKIALRALGFSVL